MHKIAVILATMTLASGILCGCNNNEESTENNSNTDSSKVQQEMLSIKDVDVRYKDLSEWKGNWLTFTDYCSDDKLKDAWKAISDETNISEDKLKETFEELCFVADDVKRLKVDNGVITGYDSNDDQVFRHKYELVGEFSEDSDRTVIEGAESYLYKSDEESGRFNYICMMPICSLEQTDSGIEMAEHFHFNYGNTIEQATNRSGIPTMVEDGISDAKKSETLITFFLGSAKE